MLPRTSFLSSSYHYKYYYDDKCPVSVPHYKASKTEQRFIALTLLPLFLLFFVAYVCGFPRSIDSSSPEDTGYSAIRVYLSMANTSRNLLISRNP